MRPPTKKLRLALESQVSHQIQQWQLETIKNDLQEHIDDYTKRVSWLEQATAPWVHAIMARISEDGIQVAEISASQIHRLKERFMQAFHDSLEIIWSILSDLKDKYEKKWWDIIIRLMGEGMQTESQVAIWHRQDMHKDVAALQKEVTQRLQELKEEMAIQKHVDSLGAAAFPHQTTMLQ